MRRNTNPKTRRKRNVNEIQNQSPQQESEVTEKQEKGFYACYLLTSLCPRFKGHTYIGYTVNPRRRIRQHNGEIRSGAFRTKKRRPWEMVFCIYGFPTNVAALQFEWAWQHPTESLAVRQAAATFKSFSGVANKIKLAYTMLTLPAWQSLNITVNYFSTKYKVHSAGCPSLPKNMKVQVCPIDELPCYCDSGEILFEDRDDEDAWDGEDEYERAGDGRETDEAKLVEFEACSMYELPCYNGREESLLEGGYVEDGKDDEAVYSELGNMNRMAKEKYKEANSTSEIWVDAIAHTSADYVHSIDKISDKQSGWIKEYGKQEQRDPPSPEPDQTLPFCFRREVGDRDILTLTDENISEMNWQRVKKFSKEVVADKDDEAEYNGASNTSQAIKEKHVDAIVNSSAGYAHSNDKTSDKEFGWLEEYSRQDQRDSPSPDLGHAEPFGFLYPPLKKASSIISSFSARKNGGRDVLTLIDENVSGVDWGRGKKSSSNIVTARNQQSFCSCSITKEIEVIDLLSPSPECGIRSSSKKRRVSSVCPVIIDLT